MDKEFGKFLLFMFLIAMIPAIAVIDLVEYSFPMNIIFGGGLLVLWIILVISLLRKGKNVRRRL